MRGIAALLLRQLRGLGWSGVFAFNAADDIFSSLAQGQSEGVIGPQNWAWTVDDNQTKSFVSAYKEAYGNNPSPHSIVYYDGVKLLAEAAAKGGDSRSGILTALKAMNAWEGIQGDYTPSGEGGNMISDVVIIEYDSDIVPQVVGRFE